MLSNVGHVLSRKGHDKTTCRRQPLFRPIDTLPSSVKYLKTDPSVLHHFPTNSRLCRSLRARACSM